MKMKQALFAAVPVMMMGLVVSGAKGQLRPCPDIDQVTGYKVLLDDVKLAKADAADQRTLKDLWSRYLLTRLTEDDSEPGSVEWQLVACEARSPRSTEFSSVIIRGLVDRDVVLEIWGAVDGESVFLNYAFLPLPAKSNVRQFWQREYKTKSVQGSEVARALAKIDEIKAYALIMRAVRSSERDGVSAYDQASQDLGKSYSILKKSFAAPETEQKALLAYVQKKRCEIIETARTSPQYKGLWKSTPEVQVKALCPEVTP